MSSCPVGSNLGFTCDGYAELEELTGCNSGGLTDLFNHSGYLWCPSSDLYFVMDPSTECVVTIPAMLEATGGQGLVYEDAPLLADQCTCGLQ